MDNVEPEVSSSGKSISVSVIGDVILSQNLTNTLFNPTLSYTHGT